jgi:hypothetical protein
MLLHAIAVRSRRSRGHVGLNGHPPRVYGQQRRSRPIRFFRVLGLGFSLFFL